MPKLNGRIPKYRLHKASRRGVVTLDGQDLYCGPYGDPASRETYDRLIAEWLANGRRLHPERQVGPEPLTINELVVSFWDYAEGYYRRTDGSQTSQIECLRQAIRPLVELYGDISVTEFGPLALKAVRQRMIEYGWCRGYINDQIGRLKLVFRWGTEEELVPGSIYEALRAVRGLKRGRTEARESEPVKPVPDTCIQKTLPHVASQVRAMIELQLLTGMRPGEVVTMRSIDINTRGEVWVYTPEHHKTAHHGHKRVIYLGPKAQEIVSQFLIKGDRQAFLFSPAEAEESRLQRRERERKTPRSCGNRRGTNRKSKPKRTKRDRYDVASYRRAITRGCDKAFPPPADLQRIKVEGRKATRWETHTEWKERLGPDSWAKLLAWQREHRWHPHQLRHNAATEIRRRRGIDAARAVLGHRSLAITDVYAEIDVGLAEQVAREAG
jgi:integrase